jgi:hypothetical protein
VADVRAASPLASPWFAILNPEGGREYDAPDAGPIDEVTARAVAWAGEAGLSADPTRVARAIGMSPGPFSEGIDEFLEALGFRFGNYEPFSDNDPPAILSSAAGQGSGAWLPKRLSRPTPASL